MTSRSFRAPPSFGGFSGKREWVYLMVTGPAASRQRAGTELVQDSSTRADRLQSVRQQYVLPHTAISVRYASVQGVGNLPCARAVREAVSCLLSTTNQEELIMRKLFVSLLMAAFAAASVSAYSADPSTQQPPQKQAKKKKKSAAPAQPAGGGNVEAGAPACRVAAILRVRRPPAAEQSPARRRPGQVEASNHCHAPSKPNPGRFFIHGGDHRMFASKLHIGSPGSQACCLAAASLPRHSRRTNPTSCSSWATTSAGCSRASTIAA